MDRRTLVFKTSFSSQLSDDFLDQLDAEYNQCIQTCVLGCHIPSQLNIRSVFSSVLPDGWGEKIVKKEQFTDKITFNAAFGSNDVQTLCMQINERLDSIAEFGRDLLQIVWVTDKIPEEPGPGLYGALDRAHSWHGGRLLIVPEKLPKTLPDWLSLVKGEVLLDLSLLSSFMSSTLNWQGSLSLNSCDDRQKNHLLEGFELHFQQDELDLSLRLLTLDLLSTAEEKLYFDNVLELVTVVDPLAVPRSLITDKHFDLTTNLEDDDDLSGQFMERGFNESAYIARLRYSRALAKEFKPLDFVSWKKFVIEGEDPQDCADYDPLGPDIKHLYFLIYNDMVPFVHDNGFRRSMSCRAILLNDPSKVQGGLVSAAIRRPIPTPTKEGFLRGVKNYDIDFKEPLTRYMHKRKVIAQILNILKEERSSLISNTPPEQLVIMLDNYVDQFWSKAKVTSSLEESEVLLERKPTAHNSFFDASSSEKILLACHQRQKLLDKPKDSIDNSKRNESDKRREDTISLEAREITKFFDLSTGSPNNSENLDRESWIYRRDQLAMSEEDYSKLFKKNFARIDGPEESNQAFAYSGYKFQGEQFHAIRFTKYHDVYYNNDPLGVRQDDRYQRIRDSVGRGKELSSTFDSNKVPQRIKLNQPQASAASRQLRRSPRKKPQATVSSAASSPQSVMSSEPGKPGSVDNRASTRQKNFTEAEQVRRKELRIAVFTALLGKGIKEKHPIFKNCFATLFKTVQAMHPLDCSSSTSAMMALTAKKNVSTVIRTEKMKATRK